MYQLHAPLPASPQWEVTPTTRSRSICQARTLRSDRSHFSINDFTICFKHSDSLQVETSSVSVQGRIELQGSVPSLTDARCLT